MAKRKKKAIRDPENDVPQEVKDALSQVERILDTIEEDVPEYAKNRATEFFESVEQKTRDVGQTIERTNRVTEGQQRALDGWEAGVRKWVKR